jgi:hypothetical protein
MPESPVAAIDLSESKVEEVEGGTTGMAHYNLLRRISVSA